MVFAAKGGIYLSPMPIDVLVSIRFVAKGLPLQAEANYCG
tara:strand:- start:4116 stop:4235 length:120 start_codon:yes stop_codon:yes gene_type:complete